MYFQLAFVIHRVKALAPQHPEWKDKDPFASLLKGDMKGVAASGEKGLMQLVAATPAEDLPRHDLPATRHPVPGDLFRPSATNSAAPRRHFEPPSTTSTQLYANTP